MQLIGATIIAFFAASLFCGQTLDWDWQKSQSLAADQSLRNATLTQPEKVSLATAIANELKDYADDLGTEKQRQEAALNTRVLKIDLNRDRQPEIIAQGMVGSMACLR